MPCKLHMFPFRRRLVSSSSAGSQLPLLHRQLLGQPHPKVLSAIDSERAEVGHSNRYESRQKLNDVRDNAGLGFEVEDLSLWGTDRVKSREFHPLRLRPCPSCSQH